MVAGATTRTSDAAAAIHIRVVPLRVGASPRNRKAELCSAPKKDSKTHFAGAVRHFHSIFPEISAAVEVRRWRILPEKATSMIETRRG